MTTCLRVGEVPETAVPVFTGRPCRVRDGFVPIGEGGCIRAWQCADGNQEYRPVVKIGNSLRWGGPDGVHRCEEGEAPGPGFICDAARPGQEGYGRNIRADGSVIVPEGVDHDQPWKRAGICAPVICPAETPVPTARPTAGPTLPDPPPTDGVRDFTLAFTNASNVCRNYKDHGDGVCSCEPDGAHRFKGTLVPQEKFVQNTVDRDHWVCAIEPCVKPDDKTDAEWAEILQAHRDTYQLGGGDEWIVAQGIRHEWRYAGTDTWNVASQQGNPYQAEFRATCGARVEARGCMDAGAYSCPDSTRGTEQWGEFDCAPEHRRPVPGAGACGQQKTYEVKR